jgi:hypothetical protein
MTPTLKVGRTGTSRLRLVGVGMAAAALVALAPARSDADSMYVHSATSGKLAGGRLTLHGVGRSVTWTTTSGSAGVARIRRAHERLFPPGSPATGTLHIGGQSGGEESVFRLSKPRYSAPRHTVSYRAKPLAKRRAAVMAAAAATRRFGTASLSVVPHPSLGSGNNGGNDCQASIWNPPPGNPLILQSSSKWDTDDWNPAPSDRIEVSDEPLIESEGGTWRGCHWEAIWQAGDWATAPLITIEVSWPWTQLPTSTCTVSNPQLYQCVRDDHSGTIGWDVNAN